MIYDGKDGIMSMLWRKPRNEVHCNLLKWECILFSRDAVEGYFPLMYDNFILLAVGASFYVVGYPLVLSYPAVYLGCFSDGFISSWVSGCGVVVYEGHQLSFGCFGGCRDDFFNEQFWF